MNRTASPPPAIRGDATREALIAAALVVFARDGFDAASTRTIAERAGINQALIGYHFGGKEGLYLAVFDHITQRLQTLIGPLVQSTAQQLDAAPLPTTAAARRRRWLPPILAMVDATLSLMLSQETEHWCELMLREQAHPTAAFDQIYSNFLGPTLALLVELVMRLRDEHDRTHARLRVIDMLGQVIVWRMARATTQRLLAWETIDEEAIARIKQTAIAGIRAQLLA
jgi:AcrR family transcriptional regulator